MNIFNWLPAGMRDSLIRHLLTTFGGVLVAKGLINEAMLDQLIGAILTIFGVVWAIGNKKDEETSATPATTKTTTKK